MLIRDERPEDASRITHIQYTAFKGHPVHAPGAEPVEHHLVTGLRAANALTLSLLVEKGRQAVGHIAVSPAVVGAVQDGWFLLGPLGVLPPFQGQGLGSALVAEALRRLGQQGAAGVVLVGEPGFYTRFGFACWPDLGYPGVPGEYVLAARFGPAVPAGAIRAHPAFALAGV